MLTTVTPEAQLLSAASNAATPPKLAPYPTLVGTAMTGVDTSPPTTDGSAPSIPATTITTAARVSDAAPDSTRWIPATPTSVNRSTSLPSAVAVTAASSATGRSLVPAVTIRIVPRPRGAGSDGAKYAQRPSSLIARPVNAAANAARAFSSARVMRNP